MANYVINVDGLHSVGTYILYKLYIANTAAKAIIFPGMSTADGGYP